MKTAGTQARDVGGRGREFAFGNRTANIIYIKTYCDKNSNTSPTSSDLLSTICSSKLLNTVQCLVHSPQRTSENENESNDVTVILVFFFLPVHGKHHIILSAPQLSGDME